MSDLVRWIGCRPKPYVESYSGYIINGNRFHTRYVKNCTQNSGVSLEAETMCRSSARDTSHVSGNIVFYGVIRDIILLDYHKFKLPIFHCDWANIGSGVKVEECFTLVNLHQGQHQFENDPFIFASQANQVFYSRHDDTSNWYVVLKAPRRGVSESDTNGNDCIPFAPLDVSNLTLEDKDYERHDYEVMDESVLLLTLI